LTHSSTFSAAWVPGVTGAFWMAGVRLVDQLF
jgi:hypothetical protein